QGPPADPSGRDDARAGPARVWARDRRAGALARGRDPHPHVSGAARGPPALVVTRLIRRRPLLAHRRPRGRDHVRAQRRPRGADPDPPVAAQPPAHPVRPAPDRLVISHWLFGDDEGRGARTTAPLGPSFSRLPDASSRHPVAVPERRPAILDPSGRASISSPPVVPGPDLLGGVVCSVPGASTAIRRTPSSAWSA